MVKLAICTKSTEVSRQLFARQYLGISTVLFRQQDGTAVAPSVWTEGGPDNKTTTTPDGENFAALSESAPLLEDHPASLKLPFILEWKLDGTTPSSLESQLARTAAALN